jgi:hypothetical protein
MDPKPDPEPEPGFFGSKNSSVILLKIESPLMDPEPEQNLGPDPESEYFESRKPSATLLDPGWIVST